jgi:hypothetical protein
MLNGTVNSCDYSLYTHIIVILREAKNLKEIIDVSM